MILIYTNKKSFFGPLYRYLFYEKRVPTDWIRMPNLCHYAFQYLFQPSPHLMKRLLFLQEPADSSFRKTGLLHEHLTKSLAEAGLIPKDQAELAISQVRRMDAGVEELERTLLQEQLEQDERDDAKNQIKTTPGSQRQSGGGFTTNKFRPAPLDVFRDKFLALHFRGGDLRAGFGQVNEDQDTRQGLQDVVRMLGCAFELEKLLQLPHDTTRWYLATDSPSIFHIPQVQGWME